MKLIINPLQRQTHHFNRLLFAVIFAALTSTWFTLVCVWPFLILGFAALNQETFAFKKSYLGALALLTGTVCCGHGAFTYWNTAILYPANPKSSLANFTHINTLPSADRLKTSYNYNGLHLGHYLLNLIKKSSSFSFQVCDPEFRLIFDVYDATSSPLVLDVAMLHALQYFAENKQPRFDLWEKVAQAILQKAPKRADLLISYGKELIKNKQFTKADALIKQIKHRNANDPFSLWLEGIYSIEKNNIPHGKKLMQLALDQEIEKWLFIPEKLKRQLKNRP